MAVLQVLTFRGKKAAGVLTTFETSWLFIVCSGKRKKKQKKTTGFLRVICWLGGAVLVTLYLVRCPLGEHSQRGLAALNEALRAPGSSRGTKTHLCVALLTPVLRNTLRAVYRSAAFAVVRRSRSALRCSADCPSKGLRKAGMTGFWLNSFLTVLRVPACVRIDYISLILFGSSAHLAEREASYV